MKEKTDRYGMRIQVQSFQGMPTNLVTRYPNFF